MTTYIFRHAPHVRNIWIFGSSIQSQRRFSILSRHTSFPATLYRFQSQRDSDLSDYKVFGDVQDGIELSADGLVRQRVSYDLPFSNGARFMPKTFTMQEWVRTNYDNYVESLEEGRSTSDALILSVRKGTFVPRSLTLIHEHSSQFSLQPSHPVNLKELNEILSEFYSRNATFINAEEWMDRNEYHESIADDEVEKWMLQ